MTSAAALSQPPPPCAAARATHPALPPPSLPLRTAIPIRRRKALLAVLLPPLLAPLAAAAQQASLDLQPYTDTSEGFSVLVPAAWLKVEKAGATALFEDGEEKGNSIGVVVSPVRLSSLRDFGTPGFVADKLIQAERRKESTKEAQVISFTERAGHEGVPVYEFEYTVDSTRGGMKRMFSAAFVNSKKLYLLNIVHSDRPDKPLGGIMTKVKPASY